jgi:putative DNA primase/helicase
LNYGAPITEKYALLANQPRGFHKNQDEKAAIQPRLLTEKILDLSVFLYYKDTKELRYFNGQIYQPNGEEEIKQTVNLILGPESTQHWENEAIVNIQSSSDSAVVRRDNHYDHVPPPALLPFKDSVYCVVTEKTEPYHKSMTFTSQIPISYDPNADCPLFKKCLDEWLIPEDHAIAQEWLGYCLLRDYPIHKALLCVGGGRNGKSTFLGVIDNLVGYDNVCHVPLQNFAANRFMLAQLWGKYANTAAELSDKAVRQTDLFKKLTGGDMITAEKKNKNPFDFKNHAKLTFSCNKIPESYDMSDAYFDRFLILNFPNQFLDDKADKELGDKLKAELPGILNYALAGLQRLLQNQKFSYNKSLEETRQYYQRASSTVACFVEDALDPASQGEITVEGLYMNYAGYCRDHKITPLTKPVFARKLPEYVAVTRERHRIEGRLTYVWAGIKYKNGETEHPEQDKLNTKREP